jgi:hypothetical protein
MVYLFNTRDAKKKNSGHVRLIDQGGSCEVVTSWRFMHRGTSLLGGFRQHCTAVIVYFAGNTKKKVMARPQASAVGNEDGGRLIVLNQ